MVDRRQNRFAGWATATASALALGLGAAAVPAQTTAPELAELPLAQLLDLEVSGASRVAARRSESAATVNIVTREQIRALGYRTLAEALAGLRGTMLVSDRIYDYLGVRGFFAGGDYNTRVLLLLDGNRVNDRLYDQAYLGGEFPLDLDEVERIEFIPGQGSAVYGANALFGVVNVVTRAAGPLPGGGVAAWLGRHGERGLRLQWQQPGAAGGWRLAATRTHRDGPALADVAGGTAATVPGLQRERRSQLRARYDDGGWSFSLVHADREQHVPWGAGLVFGDDRNLYRDTVTLLGLQHESAAGPHEQLTWRVHAGSYRFVGDYVVDYPPVTLNRDLGRGRWWGAEARLTSTRLAGHRLVAGLEWERVGTLAQRNEDIEPGTDLYLDDHRGLRRAALFAEDQVALGEHWTLHLGGRFDRSDGGSGGAGHAGSPRIALHWHPAEGWHVNAIHGRAFRRANAYEAYYDVDAPAGYRRNPSLGAERVRGDELGVEWLPQREWRAAASLYRNRADGLLILGYDAAADRYQFDNGGAFAARGIEAELEHAGPALRWRINAAFNDDRSAAATGFPQLYPARQLKALLMLPLGRDWQLGAEAQAASRRGAAPGHALANLALGGPLPIGAAAYRPTLQLTLRNAFDRRLQTPGPDAQRLPLLPLAGRQWRLVLEWPLG